MPKVAKSLVQTIFKQSMFIFTPVIFLSAQHSLQLIALSPISGSYLLALIVLPKLDVYTALHAITNFSHTRSSAALLSHPLWPVYNVCLVATKLILLKIQMKWRA